MENGIKLFENEGVARKGKIKPEPKKGKQPKERGKAENGGNGKFYCMVHGTNNCHASDE